MASFKPYVMLPAEKDNGATIGFVQRPLVFCKDCIHRGKVATDLANGKVNGFLIRWPDEICPCNCDDPFYSWLPDDDFFCAYGKENDT